MRIKPISSIKTSYEASFDQETKTVEIKAGTILNINPDVRNGVPAGNFDAINEYICQGLVCRNAEGNLVVVDSLFESPSAAWVLVSGTSGSGWKKWIIADDGPYHDMPLDALRQDDALTIKAPKLFPISKKEFDRVIFTSDETDLYFRLTEFFKKHRRFFEFTSYESLKRNRDLNSPGVYVIKKRFGETIYVGMAGKINREDDQFQLNKGTIFTRITRSTLPYTFDDQHNQNVLFRFSPNYSQSNLKNYPIGQRYAEYLNMNDLELHCFVLQDSVHEVSPTLLESIFLQNYFKLNSDLPAANNQL
jgi:hypothetical protein